MRSHRFLRKESVQLKPSYLKLDMQNAIYNLLGKHSPTEIRLESGLQNRCVISLKLGVVQAEDHGSLWLYCPLDPEIWIMCYERAGISDRNWDGRGCRDS